MLRPGGESIQRVFELTGALDALHFENAGAGAAPGRAPGHGQRAGEGTRAAARQVRGAAGDHVDEGVDHARIELLPAARRRRRSASDSSRPAR